MVPRVSKRPRRNISYHFIRPVRSPLNLPLFPVSEGRGAIPAFYLSARWSGAARWHQSCYPCRHIGPCRVRGLCWKWAGRRKWCHPGSLPPAEKESVNPQLSVEKESTLPLVRNERQWSDWLNMADVHWLLWQWPIKWTPPSYHIVGIGFHFTRPHPGVLLPNSPEAHSILGEKGYLLVWPPQQNVLPFSKVVDAAGIKVQWPILPNLRKENTQREIYFWIHNNHSKIKGFSLQLLEGAGKTGESWPAFSRVWLIPSWTQASALEHPTAPLHTATSSSVFRSPTRLLQGCVSAPQPICTLDGLSPIGLPPHVAFTRTQDSPQLLFFFFPFPSSLPPSLLSFLFFYFTRLSPFNFLKTVLYSETTLILTSLYNNLIEEFHIPYNSPT